MALELSGDFLVADDGLKAVLRVDPATGDRIVVSSNTVGSGPSFNKPRALALESSGGILAGVVATAVSGIMHQGEVYVEGRIN